MRASGWPGRRDGRVGPGVRLGLVWLIAAAGAASAAAEPAALVPGLYEIEVRLGLPNVLEVGPPRQLTRCLTAGEIASGRAFFVRSENPIRACGLADYAATGTTVRYRIRCPGPNAASGDAEFEATGRGYRGTIRMQMGGKNMTMSETQVAVRVGECDPERP
jgi:hypothetical protein